MSVGPHDAPCLVPGVAQRERGGRHLFIHPRRPRWVLLNAMAAGLARRLDGRRTLRALAAEVAAGAGVPTARVETDLLDLAARLRELGFLEAGARAAEGPQPFVLGSLFLRLTDACNLRCTQCYADSGGAWRPSAAELSTSEVCALLAELRDAGGRAVTFSGGEPLLRPDLSELAAEARRLGLQVTIVTNGTRLDPTSVARLLPLVDHLQVSLDGATAPAHDALRGRGSFEAVLAGLRAVVAAGGAARLRLSCTLLAENLDSALALPALARSLGVRCVRYVNVVSDGRARGRWARMVPPHDRLLAFYERLFFELPADPHMEIGHGLHGFFPQVPDEMACNSQYCPVSLTPAVAPGGDVFPCSMFERPAHRVGNVRTDGGLTGVLRGGGLQRVREALRRRPDEVPACRACDWRGPCQGGCAAVAEMTTGTTNAPDGHCDIRDSLYMRLIFGAAEARA